MSEYFAQLAYDEYLNEIDGDVEICGNNYEPARILKEVDPIAYRCGFADWLDAESDYHRELIRGHLEENEDDAQAVADKSGADVDDIDELAEEVYGDIDAEDCYTTAAGFDAEEAIDLYLER